MSTTEYLTATPPATQANAAYPAAMRPPVSVVILTLNEQANLADCLASCRWCDDVHLLDSGSSDRTADIARAAGVPVHVHAFTSFGDQRNWAIDHIPCKHPWHFHLDADERFTPALVAEMFKVLGVDGQASRAAGYLVPSKLIFMDKWLRHSGGYPTYQMRLFRLGKCRFIDYGHGQREQTSGEIGMLVQPYLHFNFSKGMKDWFSKHNRYSSREAQEACATPVDRPRLSDIWGRDRVRRRRALKSLTYRLRGRDLFRFFYMYVIRSGWLDATPGFHYCAMIATYDLWTELKIREQEQDWSNRTLQLAAKMLGGAGDITPDANAAQRVDIFIPTFNEAMHIADVVRNARRLGEVFVLDSFSTDGTQQLARDAGATVLEHAFLNYADQKNWGLDHLPFTGNWIFILDADERITEPLREEILSTINQPDAANGYLVNRLNLLMGRPIRHGGFYPAWNLRLFRRGKARYEERAVHEHMLCDGPTRFLQHEMLHIRAETVSQFIAKHLRYADMEAGEWVKSNFGGRSEAHAGALFENLLKYRQVLRRLIWPRLPMRPLWRLVFMYIWRLGFMDGAAGWRLAWLLASYEYMITLLYKEKLLVEQRRRHMRRPSKFESPAS